MVKKKALLISGGGAWGAYGGGTLQRLNREYDTVIGVSTGSLLGPLAAIREWELLKAAYTNTNSYNVFDGCWYKGKPLNKNGNVRKLPIIISLLLGHKSVYTTKALRKTIDKYYPKECHDKIQNKKIDVRVGTQNFAQHPPKTHYFGSLDETYEDFKDWVWCSGSFPIYGSLIKKSWRDNDGNFHVGQWTDGSVSDLIGIDELKGDKYSEVDIMLHQPRVHENLECNRVRNLVENLDRTMHAVRHDIVYDYFYERIKRLNEHGTKVTIYWLPRELSENSMNINSKLMTAWWDEGYDTAFDPDRIEVFNPIKKKF